MTISRRIVIFLGAGASRPFGFPLTAEILPWIYRDLGEWKRTGTGPGWCKSAHKRDEDFGENLRKFVRLILPGIHPKHKSIGGSIIDVLSQVDHMIRDGRALRPGFGEQELRAARHKLNVALNGVLLGSKKRELKTAFVKWILRSARFRRRTTILSTNYDVAYELPLYRALEEQERAVPDSVDMGVSLRTHDSRLHHRPKKARLAVFKLHGSLNWLRCEVCRQLYVNTHQRIASLEFWTIQNDYNTCDCGGRLRSLIVAPSLVRDTHDAHLNTIWNAALDDLRRASEWVFIGYSLPVEDVAIRTLLLQAIHTRKSNLRVRVALFDEEEQWQRTRFDAEVATTRARPRGKADPQANHLLAHVKSAIQAADTRDRYTAFFERRFFDNDEDYYPGGVEEIIDALAAES